MHGIFSRTSRLTKAAQTQFIPETPSVASKTTVASRARASMSPSSSTLKLNKSNTPSPAGSTLSLASTSARDGGPAKIGDRVIVSSQTGTKTGTLRYVGPTDFAQGDWAGVELDTAMGKNDGSVGDKRYFECKAKHGLFAPLHKVTKSPSNRMRKLSQSSTINSPAKLCRQRSDLSDVSMVSTASSPATQGKKRSISR